MDLTLMGLCRTWFDVLHQDMKGLATTRRYAMVFKLQSQVLWEKHWTVDGFALVRDSSIHVGTPFHHALVVPKCRVPLIILEMAGE